MVNENFSCRSTSTDKTRKLGNVLGSLAEPGQIVLLAGELGSGKTIFVKGMAEGMGIKERVTSPTYSLAHEYDGDPPLYHLDLYRLEDKSELYDIGIYDYLERDGIIAIEWPELVLDIIGNDYIKVDFFRADEDCREVNVEASGHLSRKVLKGMRSYADSGN